MEGPSGDRRPRTAGERTGEAANAGGVRDWQKNTWFGPAPLNSNPFEEPEDAPELKASRSENVNERMGDFWNAPDQGYRNATGAWRHPENGDRHQATRTKSRKRNNVRLIAGVILTIAAVLLILRFAVFSVKEIQIIGNSSVSAESIIRTSGIGTGANILTLDEKSVEERIQRDYRLQFRYMYRELPSRVVICVREREACCWLTYCGIIYKMDKYRMVLEETEDPNGKPQDLVEVEGLEVRSNTVVGQYLSLGSETQQSIFTDLFLEMKILSCTDQIAEADISNTDSILLVTRDGFTVGLGNRDNLHAKLRSMLLVRKELISMGSFGGTINVSNPETPIYTP